MVNTATSYVSIYTTHSYFLYSAVILLLRGDHCVEKCMYICLPHCHFYDLKDNNNLDTDSACIKEYFYQLSSKSVKLN